MNPLLDKPGRLADRSIAITSQDAILKRRGLSARNSLSATPLAPPPREPPVARLGSVRSGEPPSSTLAQPGGCVAGVISEDQIGPGAAEAEQRLEDHRPLIDPASLGGRLHHRVLA